MKRVFFILVLLFAGQSLRADQVQLKSGDRFTGSIIRADQKTITLKTESAGDLSIALAGVESYASDAPVYLTTADGKTLLGAVKYTGAAIDIQTAESGQVSVPVASLAVLRSKETYDVEVLKYEQAGFFDLWSGFVEAGLSLSGGNSETLNLAIGANATRSALSNKTSLYFASLYATSDVSGESETTANSLRGGGRYETSITDHLTVFGFSDLEHNEFQNLDVRWVVDWAGTS